MRKNKIGFRMLGGIIVCLASGMILGQGKAAVPAEKTVKLGTSYQITDKKGQCRSSDISVAYVNNSGVVTAKKIGKTTIRVKKNGRTYTQKLSVVANGKMKRGVKVSTGEIAVADNLVTYQGTNIKLKVTRAKKVSGGSRISSVETSAPLADVTPGTGEIPWTGATPVTESQSGEKTSPGIETVPATATAPVATAQTVNNTLAPTQRPESSKIAYTICVTLKNQGSKPASKVILYGTFRNKKYKLNFGRIQAGKTKTVKKTASIKRGEYDPEENELELSKLLVYSNKMYTSYDYDLEETTFHYGTKDTRAPEITGFVKKDSYNQNMPFMVVYSDDEDYDYYKYVKATDDRDSKVDLLVNTDHVNFKKAGKYWITYIAEDKAGNISKARARIEVRKAKTVDEYAGEVLSGIIKKDWSVYQKATAIYNYTRRHISYVGYSDKSSWEAEAVHGIRYGRGDCFTYYAVARALLTKAGIPNIEVKRYRGAGHHWWNMVYVNGGWYHYDCGPRIGGGRFCMLTDTQLTNYSRTHGNKYIWNYAALPKSPTKTLTTIF